MEVGLSLSSKLEGMERTILDHHTMRETTTYIMCYAVSDVVETSKKLCGVLSLLIILVTSNDPLSWYDWTNKTRYFGR
jgi:hypothetical protein